MQPNDEVLKRHQKVEHLFRVPKRAVVGPRPELCEMQMKLTCKSVTD